MAPHGDNAVNTKHWSNIVLCIWQYVAVYQRTSSVGASLYHYSVYDLATTGQARNLNTERHRRVPKWDSHICRIRGRRFSAALRSQFELCVDLVKSFVSLWYLCDHRRISVLSIRLFYWWCSVALGVGWGAVGGRLEPYTALYRNNERGGKGSEEKISSLLAVGVINCSWFLPLTWRPICI